MELKEFVLANYPQVWEAFSRYSNMTVLPIGTKVKTLRAGFGGSGYDLRVVVSYWILDKKKDWVKSTSPVGAFAYVLGHPKPSRDPSTYISMFEKQWQDFEVIKE
jgi:hypothetical protein